MMRSHIKVLVVTNTYPTEANPGDTPCIKDQVEALRARGVAVDVMHIGRGSKLNYAKAAGRLGLLPLLQRRYDLIHAYYGHCGLAARFQFKYPIVVTFRGSDLLSAKDGPIGRSVAKRVAGVIVMSEEMKRVSGRSDAHVIPFGVNLDLFAPRPMAEARQALGLPPDVPLVLFPWRPARPEKRIDVIEAAMQHLQQDYPQARLMVVFDKPHATIARYMNACNVMILASEHEGSPMAVREALACGLPIVSVDVGDVRQLIGAIDGCYMCEQDPGDIAAKLGAALQRGARIDGTHAATIGAVAAAEKVLDVYKFVISKNRKHN